MKKKIKCNICGVKFHPKREYGVQEPQGAFAVLAGGSKVYDAMDCPSCGCQKILSVRIPEIENIEKGDACYEKEKPTHYVA